MNLRSVCGVFGCCDQKTMARRVQKRVRTLPDGSLVELDDRGWEVLLELMLAGEQGVTQRELGSRLRLSRSRVSEVLGSLNSRWVDVGGKSQPWRASEVLRTLVGDEHARSAAIVELDAAKRALRRTGAGRTRRTRADEIELAVGRAASMFLAGDAVAASRAIRECGLTLGVALERVPPKERGRVRVLVSRLHADIAMQDGDARRAIRIAKRALPMARTDFPSEAASLHAIHAAALRMIGDAGALRQAVDAYASALEFAECRSISQGESLRLRRWVYASSATPLTLMGDAAAAAERIARAWDVASGDDLDGLVENLLLECRVALVRNDLEQATSLVTEAEGFADAASHWVRSWLPRYKSDIAAGGAPAGRSGSCLSRESALLQLGQAWELCRGFGFQRRLLLARFASLDIAAADEVGHATWEEVTKATARVHRDAHACRPSECRVCGRESLTGRIRHALNIVSDRDWSLLL